MTHNTIALPISIFKQQGCYVAYSPTLDISTVGDSYEHARKRLEEATTLFFEELRDLSLK